MRSDLRELEITLGELKRLTGLNWRYQISKGVKQLRPVLPLLLLGKCFWFIILIIYLFAFLVGSVAIIYSLLNSYTLPTFSQIIWGLLWSGISFALCSGFFILSLRQIKIIKNQYYKINVFNKEINQYCQLILNINTLDELESVGNPVKLSEREKVLEALRINRENLVRVLQTERILRENPQFRPEQFNVDLSGLRSLQATEKATEYGRFLDEALQIGVSVQTEMRKLENKRLGL
jgi:hypothetical protein